MNPTNKKLEDLKKELYKEQNSYYPNLEKCIKLRNEIKALEKL